MPTAGTLHNYAARLTAFEHATNSAAQDLILFVGGLYDGFNTVPYVPVLASVRPGWGLAQVLISSSYTGFGTGCIRRDAEELGLAVTYFKGRGKRRVVLCGHSTGCQDIIAYFHLPSSPSLAGAILQAPVSDRDFIVTKVPSVKIPDPRAPAVPLALSAVFGSSEALITPRRWVSFAYPPASDVVDLDASEDFFSIDLSDERLQNVFGALTAPTLLLLSEKDESYAQGTDLPKLLERFQRALGRWCAKESGIVSGATHPVPEEAGQEEMRKKVGAFLDSLDGERDSDGAQF